MKTKISLTVFLVLSISLFLSAQVTIVEWNFPNNPDNNTVDVASPNPNNSACVIATVGGVNAPVFSVAGIFTWSAWASGWNTGFGNKAWEINFSTIGCRNIDISSKQRSSNTGPRDFKVQYKIGVGGTYTDVPGATSTCADNFTSGVVNCIALPLVCENQPSIYLRWVMTTNTAVGGAGVTAGGTSRIDDIVVNCNSIGYYRTVASGKWKNKAIWEYSPDNIAPYIPADTVPTYASQSITIISGDTVVIDSNKYNFQNCNFKLDEVYINTGGALHINGGYVYFNNGSLVDINVEGELMDSLSNVVTPNGLGYINWIAGATWVLGGGGTFIKARNSLNSFYQSNYAGGIINVPVTANWILRKTSTVNPNMLSAGMYYPNFILENTTGTAYDANTFGSFFTGNSTCVIYGDFKINSSGLNAITMYDSITTDALIIKGNMIINASGNFIINGDSITLDGDLTVNGSVGYSPSNSNAKKFIFSGANAQTVQTTGGSISFYNVEINKSANHLNLDKGFSVDNNFNFVNGKVFTSNANIVTFTDAANATSYSSNSFINGPCSKTGSAAFSFPIGKANDLKVLGMSNAASTVPFWTENFNNGCTSGCLANGLVSLNGTWTITDFGPAMACGAPILANDWFVSCAENGNAVGVCGSGCGGNASLHVSSTAFSPHNNATCPGGDCGANYDAGGNCDLLSMPGSTETDKQIESPIIDCSTQINITLSFKYIAGGNIIDAASLWYFDGSTSWQQLTSFSSVSCGPNLGLWRSFSILLPASAYLNSGIQIAFRWKNDDDAAGNNISFAVDDIALSSTDEFRSEYFYTNPQLIYGNNLEPGIDHISDCEYWDLSRRRGASNRQVTLSWNDKSCGVTFYNDLLVTRYNAGNNEWRNHGGTGFTGNNLAGTVTSSLQSNSFCPYTLGSLSGLNPLPIALLMFNAKALSNAVQLNWQSSNEPSTSYFNIQKSINFIDIIELENIIAKGNSSSGSVYQYFDYNPFEGSSYYRIKQTDNNGNYSFSNWEKIKFQQQFNNALTVTVNDGFVDFSLSNCCIGKMYFKVFDIYGRIVFENTLVNQNHHYFNMNGSASGIYILSVDTDEGVFNQKFVY